MDFTHPDAAPALQLDQIVWKTVKGPASVMPRMHRTLPLGIPPITTAMTMTIRIPRVLAMDPFPFKIAAK